MTLKTRIKNLVEKLCEGLHERHEVVAVSILSALSDQNVFLLGPPGTAKSLVSRRLSCAFESHKYFEYLMQRFSTPEEVFGPVSISELKKDNFKREVDGFLPTADFAFLDEIWKSSPAILNTLLTVINEKTFQNGKEKINVPLKALVSASNEIPPEGQGLEALYDRFIVRMQVPPLVEKDNFETLLNSKPTKFSVKLSKELLISQKEWDQWRNDIHDIKLSEETLKVIHAIRVKIEKQNKKLDVYISDRRWQKAAILIKAAAFFCGRKETNLADTLLLRHCLWSSNENRDKLIKIVEDSVRECGFTTKNNINAFDKEKDRLDLEIQNELFHSGDVYDTVTLAGDEYFHVRWKDSRTQDNEEVYILSKSMGTKGRKHSCDRNLNRKHEYNFDGQGTCEVYYSDSWGYKKSLKYTPKVLFHKGDKKKDVNKRLVEALKNEVETLKEKIEGEISNLAKLADKHKKELQSPFVPEAVSAIAIESIDQQAKDMDLRLKDCQRLMRLCK